MTTTTPATGSLRSTQVKLYLEQCPHSLELYDRHADTQDKTIFAVGTAAHDVAHAVGMYPDAPAEEVARIVVRRLIAKGRRGVDSEGPMSPDAAFAGRDIFMRWYNSGGDVHPHASAQYEPGIGFHITEGEWQATAYDDPTARFRIRPDVVYAVNMSSEDGYGYGLVTRDYKTSWQAGKQTVDSIQLRAQAVAVYHARHRFTRMNPDFIRREVVNLRNHEVYYDDTWLDAGGVKTIERWGQDVVDVLDAIAEGHREPRVGRHCLRCPYVRHCDARRTQWDADHSSPREVAEAYVLAVAYCNELKGALQEAAAEAPVEVDRSVVGYVGKEAQTPVDDAPRLVWDAWAGGMQLDPGATSAARGAIKAMRIGKTQIDALSKALFPERDQAQKRRAWVASMTQPVIKRRFGIWPKK